MFGQTFYFQTIRKYVTLVGTLFDDISIIRTDSNGDMTALIKVPITYAPKDKMLARIQQDPNIDRPTATITLPVMSFEMTNVRYDGARKLHTVGKVAYGNTTPGSLKYQYNPVPYNFDFELHILVKNAEDGTKIVEQILPYFTPDFTVSVNLIPEMGITMEIPVVMNGISQQDTYNGSFTERQSLTWTLGFTVKGYLYGPVKSSAIIKYANTVFYTPEVADGMLYTAVGNTPATAWIQTQPGLTANGQPTSNAAASIPVSSILATDDYGFVDTITEAQSN
jgi:hypothetical protein